MKINLKLYSILREKLPSENKGRTVLEIEDGASLADLLDQLTIKPNVVISVNGKHETKKTRHLKNGDEVIIFSSVSGG